MVTPANAEPRTDELNSLTHRLTPLFAAQSILLVGYGVVLGAFEDLEGKPPRFPVKIIKPYRHVPRSAGRHRVTLRRTSKWP